MIQLRTLGGIALRGSDGEELRAVLAQPKRLALLVYLALAQPRGPQRRDRLIALFWPEQDAERARNALSQAVFFLRRVLGSESILNRNGDEIELNRELLWCDAIAFEEGVRAGHPDDVIELYRGELLAGLHIPEVSAELEQWLDTERKRCGDLYARAVEALAEEREHARDYRGAVLWWRRLATHDRFSGRIALRLMRALAASGDRAAAIQYARIYETILANELEIESDPAVAAFARELQSGMFVAPAASAVEDRPATVTEEVPPPASRVPSRRQRRVGRGTLAGAAVLVVAIAAVMFVRLRAANATPVIHAIAVLPFQGFSSDPRQDFLAESMTDAVITELARLPQLTVISRQSVIQYRGTNTAIPEIARALGVDGIVEGTMLRDGNRIRFNVQLIYTPAERHLWAEHFDRSADDLVSLEDDLADAIARHIRTATTAQSSNGPPRRRYDPLVEGQYIRAGYELLTRTPASLTRAIDLFRTAIAADSAFAPGYAGIAEAYGLASDLGYLPQAEANDSVKVYVSRALAQDSLLSEAHSIYAGSLSEAGRFADAEREFERATQLAPGNASAHQWYAMLLATLGRGQDAVQEIDRAEELDPLSVPITTVGRRIRKYFGAPSKAGRQRAPLPQVDPTNAWARANFANSEALNHHCSVAMAQIEKAVKEIPNNVRMTLTQASVIDRCIGRRQAIVLLDRAKRLPEAHRHGLWIAMGLRRIGQLDSAFTWLDSVQWSVEQRFNFRTDKSFDSLKTDPRYQRALHRMGL